MQKLDIFFPALTANMKKGSEKAMEGLQSIYPKLFSIDINTDEGLASFRKLLQEAGGLGEQMFVGKSKGTQSIGSDIAAATESLSEIFKKNTASK